MSVILKKDSWKIKDPNTGEYRDSTVFSSTFAQDATDIVADATAAIDAQETRAAGIVSGAQADIDTIAAAVQSMTQTGTDTTLTVSGAAADAASVGDEFSELKQFSCVEQTLPNWEAGSYNAETGEIYSYSGIIRNLSVLGVPNGVVSIKANTGYVFYVLAYTTENAFVGAYKTNGSFEKSFSNLAVMSEFDFTKFPNYVFRIAARRDPVDTSIALSEGSNIFVYKTAIYETENKLTRFSNRKISIIGDSISTFYNNPYMVSGYLQYYGRSDVTSDLTNYNDTWWMHIINADQNCSIEVNASYSGSGVTSIESRPTFYDRTSSTVLGNPDVIIVELGGNDSLNSISIGSYDFSTAYASLSETTFRPAFIKGLKSLKENYPNAEIIVLGLPVLSENYRKSEFWICKRLGIEFINITNFDGITVTHPNKYQMWTIAKRILYPSAVKEAFLYKSPSDILGGINSKFSINNTGSYVLFGEDSAYVQIGGSATSEITPGTIIFYLPPPLQPPTGTGIRMLHTWDYATGEGFTRSSFIELGITGGITNRKVSILANTSFYIGDTVHYNLK